MPLSLELCGFSDVWAEPVSPVQKWAYSEINFISFWQIMVHKLKQEDLEKVAVMLRGIWLRRNKMIFEDKFTCSSMVARIAIESLEGY